MPPCASRRPRIKGPPTPLTALTLPPLSKQTLNLFLSSPWWTAHFTLSPSSPPIHTHSHPRGSGTLLVLHLRLVCCRPLYHLRSTRSSPGDGQTPKQNTKRKKHTLTAQRPASSFLSAGLLFFIPVDHFNSPRSVPSPLQCVVAIAFDCAYITPLSRAAQLRLLINTGTYALTHTHSHTRTHTLSLYLLTLATFLCILLEHFDQPIA